MNKQLLSAFLGSAAFFSSSTHADVYQDFVQEQESRLWADKAFELRENPEDYHVVRGAEDPEQAYVYLLDDLGFEDVEAELLETLEYAEAGYELTEDERTYFRIIRAKDPKRELMKIERMHWANQAYDIDKSREDARFVAYSSDPEAAYQELLEHYLRQRYP